MGEERGSGLVRHLATLVANAVLRRLALAAFLVACSPNFAPISMLAQRNSRTTRVAQCAVSAPGQIQSIGVSQCPPARGARSIWASASVKVAVIGGHQLHSATTSRFCFRDCHAVGIFVDKIGWLGGERAVPETSLQYSAVGARRGPTRRDERPPRQNERVDEPVGDVLPETGAEQARYQGSRMAQKKIGCYLGSCWHTLLGSPSVASTC